MRSAAALTLPEETAGCRLALCLPGKESLPAPPRPRHLPAAFACSLLLHAAVVLALWPVYREAQLRLHSGAAGAAFTVTLARLGDPQGKAEAEMPGSGADAAAGGAKVKAARRSKPAGSEAASGGRRAVTPSAAPRGAPDGSGDGLSGEGGGVTAPAAAHGLAVPEYPYEARLRKQEGRVVYLVKVSRSGKVESIDLLHSSRHPLLDRAALEALRKAVFIPARRGVEPVDSVKKIAFRFNLAEAAP